MMVLALVAFLMSLGASAVVIRRLARRAVRYGPGKPQRFHKGEVPRLGGVALLAGLCLGWALGTLQTLWGDPGSVGLGTGMWRWLVVLLPAVVCGIVEDMTQRIRVGWRLAMTLLSGLLALWLLGLNVQRLDLSWIDALLRSAPWLGMGIVLLAVAGLPHAFNIIDGYNGLAGVVALIICLALVHVCLQVGDRQLAAIVICLAGATAGFLVWNYPRGLLFAGDGGAYLWGSVVALASIALVQRHPQVSPWFPMLLLIYPVWETLFSIYRKLARGESPGMADALHFHQLIYRRIVRSVLLEDEARRMLKRNNRTAPYLWGFSMLSVVPAVLFWNNSPVLLAFCAVFALAYVGAYISIIRFKVPDWLRF
ncbi:glycosyltransferase family 4 protein [Comamonas flocculans]|uniref:Glycosyl transferase n=1 Tax=Comamonas flocculans TaxID=2597701 RepID=A0A5B8RUT0_9BURK|nr:glycosyltransferase [Comamonas flocculans]QEA13250.1 glycosyl transferase [Comamonas flocculans]